jgi:UDP-N-acetyl-D-glucosamine dehydrogenase
MRQIVVPLIEHLTGNSINDYEIAFSPERIDPRNNFWNLRNTPKLVAGLSTKCAESASDFYAKFINNVVVCESLEIAETAKMLENSFRLVNISFINEISIFCRQMGIDISKVIRAAATKPYGFMPFYPGAGVGGHCIPVDPIYLAEKARQIGTPIKMVEAAININEAVSNFWISEAEKSIGNLSDKRILIIGVAYKSNISDTRESPAKNFIYGLRNFGAIVSWHDDLVKSWNGETSQELSENYDLAILVTHHDNLDLQKLGKIPIIRIVGGID